MIIAFDVDDTIYKIVRSQKLNRFNEPITSQVPDYALIQVLMWFVNNGDRVHVWSAGGMDYAQMVVDKLGLTDSVSVIEKSMVSAKEHGVDLCFDDELGVQLAKVNCKIKRI